jgi:hypothetical protein
MAAGLTLSAAPGSLMPFFDHDEHPLLHLVLLDDALHVAVHLEVLHHMCQPTRHQPSA